MNLIQLAEIKCRVRSLKIVKKTKTKEIGEDIFLGKTPVVECEKQESRSSWTGSEPGAKLVLVGFSYSQEERALLSRACKKLGWHRSRDRGIKGVGGWLMTGKRGSRKTPEQSGDGQAPPMAPLPGPTHRELWVHCIGFCFFYSKVSIQNKWTSSHGLSGPVAPALSQRPCEVGRCRT